VDAALHRAVFPPTLQTRVNRVLATLSVQWSGAEVLVRALYHHAVRYLFTRVGVAVAREAREREQLLPGRSVAEIAAADEDSPAPVDRYRARFEAYGALERGHTCLAEHRV